MFNFINLLLVDIPENVPVTSVYGFESNHLRQLLNLKLKKDNPFMNKMELFVRFPELFSTFLFQMSQGDQTVRYPSLESYIQLIFI